MRNLPPSKKTARSSKCRKTIESIWLLAFFHAREQERRFALSAETPDVSRCQPPELVLGNRLVISSNLEYRPRVMLTRRSHRRKRGSQR
jgi:hypothetical protein